MRLRARGRHVAVYGVDKFPRMTDYVVPQGVRIADADRVRLGAHLSPGTTVMHEGFCNFNAGTLGTSMVEGRIVQGVVVGDGSDIGAGASIMGTLSGGGTERVSIGERCLVGANGGIGIALGDDCVVEAGLYVTAGTKVTLPDGTRGQGQGAVGVEQHAVHPQQRDRCRRGPRPQGHRHHPQRRAPRQRLNRPHTDTPADPVQTRAGPPEDQTPCRPNDRARPSPTPGHDLQRNVDAAGSAALLVLAVVVTAGWFGARYLLQSVSSPKCTITAAGSTETFDPEQTGNAALIAALSVKRGMPPRAATIAITTAFQESKIRNLRYGDRDSLGLFQQRPSQGWGTAEQILDPVHATNAFYDALVKYQGYETRRHHEDRPAGPEERIPRGLPRPRGSGPRARLEPDRPLPCRTDVPARRGDDERDPAARRERPGRADGRDLGPRPARATSP